MIKFLKGLFESSKLSSNTTAKLVSILFAIVLYIFVMGETNPEEERNLQNLKVELLNQEELENMGLVFIDQKEFTVDVKIFGKKMDLPKVSTDDIKVSADLSGAKQGENYIQLKVNNPVNIEIKEITPQQINIRLDKIVQSQRPVEIEYKGKPQEGYEVGKYDITPDGILIEGPQTKVEAVAKVVAEIDVEGIKENIRRNLPIRAVDSKGKDVIGVDIKTENVNVYLSMLRLKSVPIKPSLKGQAREGYKITKIEVDPPNVTLRGRESRVNGVDEISTRPISVEELDTVLVTEVNLDLPKNIETPYLHGLPQIRIQVEKIETKEFTFKANDIPVNNLKDNLTTNIGQLTQDIKVIISDVRSVLENVNKSDLELAIDADELGVGVYTLELKLNKNEAYENVEISPGKIEIELYNKEEEEVTETVREIIDGRSHLNGIIDMPGD